MLNKVLPGLLGNDLHDSGFLSSDLNQLKRFGERETECVGFFFVSPSFTVITFTEKTTDFAARG